MSDISTQSSTYADLWAAHRDRAGPITPADVWGLREDREFVAPSKAHLKRIARVRPLVSPARIVPVDASGGRKSINERIQGSRVVLAACKCLPAPHSVIPSDYVRPAPIPPAPKGPAKPSDPHAEGKRLERANIIALRKMMYNTWEINTIERVLRVLWAFGSAEAFYAATAR